VLSLADIIRITQEYGFQTLYGILVFGVIYLVAKGHIDVWIFKKKKQLTDTSSIKKDFDVSIKEILASEFFRNIKFKIAFDIPTDHFSKDPALDILYKDLLICLYHSYQVKIEDKISKMKEDDECGDWVNSFMETIYLAMDMFQKEAKQMGIPEDAIVEFTVMFSPVLHQIYTYFSIIDASEPKCILRKTRLFLLTLELILVNATAHTQEFNVFEGKLDGKEYKGNVIGMINSTQPTTDDFSH